MFNEKEIARADGTELLTCGVRGLAMFSTPTKVVSRAGTGDWDGPAVNSECSVEWKELLTYAPIGMLAEELKKRIDALPPQSPRAWVEQMSDDDLATVIRGESARASDLTDEELEALVSSEKASQ